ncbi:MAG TPA: hypothetical protein DCZ55_11505 [Cyanobacteria bacterium UBA11371]|nr:hypothetical protein [Cyanobacteria bacterium UBA11371]HBE36993.1 hypothetical protein [Cyanobacteria bacterium UBA11368]
MNNFPPIAPLPPAQEAHGAPAGRVKLFVSKFIGKTRPYNLHTCTRAQEAPPPLSLQTSNLGEITLRDLTFTMRAGLFQTQKL